MIWGMTLEPGKLYTEVMGDEVHLSMASLESRKDFATEEKTEPPQATCHIIMKTEKSEYLLCTLANGVIYQQNLDLKLMPREKVTFSVQGSNVVYLTGYSTSYPDMDDQFDEESETGDWEPYESGELLLNTSAEDPVAINEDEQDPASPVIKGESEDIIEEMNDDGVQQPEPVLELDLQEDIPDLPPQENEQQQTVKADDESDQHEMIFSIAELEANVKEEPEEEDDDDNVTIIPSDSEERLQELDDPPQDEQMQQDQTQQQQQQLQKHLEEQQIQLQTQLQEQQQQQQQQQRQLQLPPDQQQQLHTQTQYLPNVQQSMQDTSMQQQQHMPLPHRTALPINQRSPRYAQQRARARGRPVGRLLSAQRQRVRYIPQAGHQQPLQQSQPSGSFPQMQNLQSTQQMPVGYQGTTAGNVAARGQPSGNAGVQGQAMVNQPGTSRQSVQGPSTSNASFVEFGKTRGPTYGPKKLIGKTCKYCGRVFNRRWVCQRHELTHTGQRPYKCKYCTSGFQRREQLLKHEWSHTGAYPHWCIYCSQGFPAKRSKLNHEKVCNKRDTIN